MNRQFSVISVVLVMFFIAACSSVRRKASPVAELPIVQVKMKKNENMKDNSILVLDTLSIDEAISRALENNPELQVYKTEIKAREAHTYQESLLPNPELDIELENFAGSGLVSELKSTETTLTIGQLIELGGKRSKRTRVAKLESDIALLRYEIQRIHVITQVRSVFTKVLLAQNKLNLDRKLLKLAQSFKTNIDAQVYAGRLSGAEAARAQVELYNRDLALRRNRRELNNARSKLSSIWGADEADFNFVKGSLSIKNLMPDSENLTQALDKSPLLLEQKAIINKQKAETELAKAMAIPDPVLSAGYRRFNETDDQAFVTGLSIALPIFNRNQGGKQEAKLREQQSEQQFQSIKNQLKTEAANRLKTVNNLSEEIQTIQDIIIPQAQKAYDIIYRNYQLGKYAMIDVLDAQRQLFDAEGSFLDVLAEVNLEIIALEGLLGQTLESL